MELADQARDECGQLRDQLREAEARAGARAEASGGYTGYSMSKQSEDEAASEVYRAKVRRCSLTPD